MNSRKKLPYKYFDFKNYEGDIPVYNKEKGYGFVSKTSSMPPRRLDIHSIERSSEGFIITENGSSPYIHYTNMNSYDFGGLVFRIDVESAGGYFITAELCGGASEGNTAVSVSGMKADRMCDDTFWDSACLVPIRNYSRWIDDNTWTYPYVTGEKYIELEIEPKTIPKPDFPITVGLKSVKIEKILPKIEDSHRKRRIFILGDSTEKTYTFDEAGMSGWGQILGSMFDSGKVCVINYSMGGRSMKQMFTENRFNDVLLEMAPEDYLLLHSAHNDESRGELKGPENRFGRGSDDEYYVRWLNDIFITSILSRGGKPVLVTPMPRTSEGFAREGFSPDSPGHMRKAAENNKNVRLIDLYIRAKEYIEAIGPSQTKSIFMSVEAGESPGKTNSGSYANGHPENKIDGTHFKEAAAKVWSKLICEEIYSSDSLCELKGFLKDSVKKACESGDWSEIFPEWTDDVTYAESGDFTAENDPSYYRNQIEKLLQLGAVKKADGNNFRPLNPMKTNDFISSLCSLWGLDLRNKDIKAKFLPYSEVGTLTREKMAAIIVSAYILRFGKNSGGGYNKPPYMTDYNGTNVSPDDPSCDPNLTGEEAMYYPLVSWEKLRDKADISPEYVKAAEEAYRLGLMRSEAGIERGKMKNGCLFEPKKRVIRAKAAKTLWFLWVLGQENVRKENQILEITRDGKNYFPVVYVDL